ncbi:MAG: polysaccharide biosynthesis C-terminal domain-containing protein [Chitinophagales bacterium]
MLGKIFHTLFTRSATLIFNFLIVLGISRVLGAQGKGESTLIITSIYLIVFLANMSGGKTLIYLSPRFSALQLLLQNYSGALISSLLAAIVLFTFQLVPQQWTYAILILAFLAAILEANASLLAGKGAIKKHNILQGLQVFLTLLGLSLGFYLFKSKTLDSYIYALYFSYSTTLLLSFLWLLPKLSIINFEFSIDALKRSLNKSFEFQIADMLLLLVYRINFYLMLYFHGAASLGLFSVGVSILEVAWLTGRSISFIQFSQVSNTPEQKIAANLSLSLIKASLISSGIFLVLVLLIPGSVYAAIFGYAFEPITLYMKWLVPGIWLHNIYLITSHYFAGRGENRINIYISLSGLICTFALGLILIPNYAISGAGLAGTTGFGLMAIFAVAKFLRENKLNYKDLIPGEKDKTLLLEKIRSFISKK